MNLSKPKEFCLKQPLKICNAGLYGVIRYAVFQHTFLGGKSEVAIFDSLNDANRYANEWNRDSDAYTDYTVERLILS